ncbi:MAG: ActS/PrrB/RegB family redox-sensitive histidine kinase [Alphaproteobacteria bacterium]|nr:ActS/PrrB/RegB family redox-sensitive histidine kinase [Alphaproteobacteria bacterium]
MPTIGEKPSPFKAEAALQLALRSDVAVSLRMLVLIRWVAVIGQAATLLVVHEVLGFALPLTAALGVVAISALLNVVAWISNRAAARLGNREAAIYLAFDTLQLGVLLFLTGGLQNPFAILMLAPATVSATILTRRTVAGLSALTVVAITVLALAHLPLPAPPGRTIAPEPVYVLGMWVALVSSSLFITGYNWFVAEEARRMRDAYAATQLALAREQRVAAVGALAAAAAHQLGSPLATIAVVAKELVRDLPKNSPIAEDAQLLLSQSERCRMILADLGRAREGEAMPFNRMPFSAIVQSAGEPHHRAGVRVVHGIGAGRDPAGGAIAEPQVPRTPEVLHGLGNLLGNAIDFARSEVTVTTSWSEDTVAVDIVDDGPGFSPALLSRVGQPYISARADVGAHMGLGIFIAQSLLERTGARLSFDNMTDGGAHVVVEWRRSQLEGDEYRTETATDTSMTVAAK